MRGGRGIPKEVMFTLLSLGIIWDTLYLPGYKRREDILCWGIICGGWWPY